MSATPTPRRPRVLDALGEELTRAARAYEAEEQDAGRGARRGSSGRWAAGRGNPRRRSGGAAWRPRPRVAVPRAVVIALLALLLLAAVALAASLVIGRGDPIPPPPAGAVPAELRPVAGTERLAGLRVADPDGGPRWDVRTSRSRTGATCVTVGQVMGGALGLVGLDSRFRALPAGVADTCSTPQRTGATIAAARALRGGGRLQDVTAVSGVVARGVRGAAVTVAGRARAPLEIGATGAFLAVFAGTPEHLRPRLDLTEAGGAVTTLRFGDVGEHLVPDPDGGPPWAVGGDRERAGRGQGGLRCVNGVRERDPAAEVRAATSGVPFFGGSGPVLPTRCGPPGGFASIYRFVPELRVRSIGYLWNLHPARTIAWGRAPRAGAVVTVRVGGRRARRLMVDPASLGFIVVYDGHVDPRAVQVRIDGATPPAGVQSTRNALADGLDAGVRPWRSVAEAYAEATRRLPGFPRAVAASARIARAASAPAGGAAWVLRTWRARASPHGPGLTGDLRCFQIGVRAPGGDVREPLARGASRALRPDAGAGSCADLAALRRAAPAPAIRTVLDDPLSPTPRVRRVVVSGLLGPGVRSATLLGLRSGPRALRLGPDGTYLVALAPAAAGRALRVRATRAGDGRAARTSPPDTRAGACRIDAARSVRVADPDGGPPWVAGSSGACRFVGQVVAGRPAAIDPAAGTARMEPFTYALNGPRAPRGGRAIGGISVEGPPLGAQRGTGGEAGAAAQIARRTLPGRVLVSGHVRDDVVAVTLRTPRDVRTLRPAGGVYLAVYDGAFTGGVITATALLRDGRRVTARASATLGSGF